VPPLRGSPSQGLGLRSMRERCEALGGRLELTTSTGGGLSLRATVPWRGRLPAERRAAGGLGRAAEQRVAKE
jgi:signal transduction histidine kinase